MSLRIRLTHLERPQSLASQPSLVCVDEEGRVLDDGTAEMRPWIRKHQDDWPFPVAVIVGVDPLVVLGVVRDDASA